MIIPSSSYPLLVRAMAAASRTTATDLLHPQEEEYDFTQLLSSLEKNDSNPLVTLYKYQGFWFREFFLQRLLLAYQHHVEAEDSNVIVVVSSPKSGTTWLKALTFAIVNRSRFPTNDLHLHHHPLLTNNPHQLVLGLEPPTNNNNTQISNHPPSPTIVFTHTPYSLLPKYINPSTSSCKIVYITRDPKDVVVSLWHFLTRGAFNGSLGAGASIPLEDFCELFCAGVSPFGPFWKHVREYWEASRAMPHKVLFLKYEDLKRRPVVEVRGLAEFLGYGFTAEEEEKGVIEEVVKLCSFEQLSGLEANNEGALQVSRVDGQVKQVEHKLFFRRGEVGDYRNFLTPQMAQRLDRITQEKFQGLGLTLTLLN